MGADVDPSPVAFPKLGEKVRNQSPPEAVFLVDDRSRNEHPIAMWWLDRACYPLRPDGFDADVRAIVANGGTPFVLSRRPWPGTPLMSVAGDGTIYRLDKGRRSAVMVWVPRSGTPVRARATIASRART